MSIKPLIDAQNVSQTARVHVDTQQMHVVGAGAVNMCLLAANSTITEVQLATPVCAHNR